MNNTVMDNAIFVVNQLQDHASKAGREPMDFNLPQIVVVGAQSAGKSSVLENFVGREFLPRGGGIVTRRPLVVQMLHHHTEEYGEFAHVDPPRKYTDFAEIRKEIEAETDRLAPGASISRVPINLRIYSPHVLNLTLVDLPGLTLVPVGDQSADIAKQIRDVVLEYAQQSHSLILAVSPANDNLANSRALDLAKEVDPKGERTISVLTKIDLADETDSNFEIIKILSNKLKPLKLGHWGVINKSREKEQSFFNNRSVYRSPEIAKHCGTSKLQNLLVYQLRECIRKYLPDFCDKCRQRLAEMDPMVAKHHEYEAANPSDALRGKFSELNAIMRYLASAFESSIEAVGGVPAGSSAVITKSRDSGARICSLFHVTFKNNLKQICSDDEKRRGQIENEIRTAMSNCHGIRLAVFPHQKAFEAVASERIKLMHEPCVRCLEVVVDELRKTFAHHINKRECNVSRYPALRTEIQHRFESYLAQRQSVVKEVIRNFVECQRSYYNTNNKDFVNVEEIVKEKRKASAAADVALSLASTVIDSSATVKAAATLTGNLLNTGDSDTDSIECIEDEGEIISDPPSMTHHVNQVYFMLQSYVDIMRWNLYENIPKLIVHMLINDMSKYLQEDLRSDLQDVITKEHGYAEKKAAGGGEDGSRAALVGTKESGGEDCNGSGNEDGSCHSSDGVVPQLMAETAEVVAQRKEDLRMYEATREALRIAKKAFST